MPHKEDTLKKAKLVGILIFIIIPLMVFLISLIVDFLHPNVQWVLFGYILITTLIVSTIAAANEEDS